MSDQPIEPRALCPVCWSKFKPQNDPHYVHAMTMEVQRLRLELIKCNSSVWQAAYDPFLGGFTTGTAP